MAQGGVTVEGTEQFKAAAHALNQLGDRDVRRAVYAGFREVGQPLGIRSRDAGAAAMPRRGGLSARLRQARVGQQNATTGSNPRVVIRISAREGYDLPALDRGQLRHPVFGRRNVWREQAVPAKAWSTEFEKGAPEVRDKVIAQLEDVTQKAMRKVHG